MNAGAGGTTRPTRVAALHRQGDQWRLVVAERTTTGSGRIVASESVPFGDVAAALSAVNRHQAQRIVRIIPACAVICRTLELSDGPEESLLSALALQAEALLPAAVPGHRRAVGLLSTAVDGGREEDSKPRRVGLLVGWAGAAPEPAVRAESETWVSESVVLSGFIGGLGSTMVAWADSDSGSIALVGAGDGRVVVRGIRETASSRAQWESAVTTALHEASTVVGVRPAPEIEFDAEGVRGLALDPAARRRLAAMADGTRGSDAGWLHQYAIAAMGAASCVSAGAGTVGLFSLPDQARGEHRSLIEHAAVWISRPRHAWAVSAAALAIMLLAPLAYAAARNALLGWRVSQVERDATAQETQEALEKRVAVYAELDARRWPMTKLIADIAGAMPVGTELEFAQLGVGDRVVLRGTAESLDLVGKMQGTLSASSVFENFEIDKAGPASGGTYAVQFDLSGRVVRPYADGKGLEDFTESTLARRLYGDRADEALAAQRDGATGEAAVRASGGSRTGGTGSGARREIFDRTTGSEAKAPEPIPEPLEASAISKMTREDAGRELASRRKAASRPDIDAESRQRLRDEQDKLRQRLRDIQAGGGAS